MHLAARRARPQGARRPGRRHDARGADARARDPRRGRATATTTSSSSGEHQPPPRWLMRSDNVALQVCAAAGPLRARPQGRAGVGGLASDCRSYDPDRKCLARADSTDPNLRERRLGTPGRPPGLHRKTPTRAKCSVRLRTSRHIAADHAIRQSSGAAGQEACGPRSTNFAADVVDAVPGPLLRGEVQHGRAHLDDGPGHRVEIEGHRLEQEPGYRPIFSRSARALVFPGSAASTMSA